MGLESSQPSWPNGLGDPNQEDHQLDMYVWAAPSSSELLWQTWGHETVLFNTASGQTHLLDALSTETLRIIEECPGTIPDLSRRLAAAFQISAEDVARRLPEILTRFETLGLAEPLQR